MTGSSVFAPERVVSQWRSIFQLFAVCLRALIQRKAGQEVCVRVQRAHEPCALLGLLHESIPSLLQGQQDGWLG